MSEGGNPWKRFEDAGEPEVRRKLAAREYGEEAERMGLAWLAVRAQDRAAEGERRNSASSLEQMRLARRANTIATAAAIAAIVAAIAAVVGVIISMYVYLKTGK